MKQQALMIGGRGRWTAAIEAAGLAKFFGIIIAAHPGHRQEMGTCLCQLLGMTYPKYMRNSLDSSTASHPVFANHALTRS